MQKRPDEYFAKVVLEMYFPEKFSDLQILDRPDLRDEKHNIGIEVTNAEPQIYHKREDLWRKALYSSDEKKREKCKEYMKKKLNIKFQGAVQSMGGTRVGELVNSIETAFDDKLNKLQNDGFKKYQQNDLFILTGIIFGHFDLDDLNNPHKYLEYMVHRNEQVKYRFDNVYFKLVGSICHFDLKSKNYNIIEYDHSEVVDEAERLLGLYNNE